MAVTKISDIIVPDVFVPYVIERTADRSELIKSGIVVPDPLFDALARQGGRLIEMPFFTDLTGDDEVLSDSGSLTPGAIGTAQDQAILHARGRAWGVNDLAKALSGADPMGAIADLVAEYWNRREQALLISILKGVFADNAANDSGDLIHDASIADGNNAQTANLIGGNAVIDAMGKLGDAAGKITAIMMHSTPYQTLQKNDLIDFIQESNTDIQIPTFLGKRVIVDDSLVPVAGGTSGYVYTSYLFGQGAIARGEGQAPVPVETDRDSLAGQEYLVNRRHFLLHPRGIAWAGATNAFPTNTTCENAASWNRVYEKKNIRIIKLLTNG